MALNRVKSCLMSKHYPIFFFIFLEAALVFRGAYTIVYGPYSGCQLNSKSAFIISTSSGFEGEARREVIKILNPVKAEKLFFKGNLYMESDQSEEEVIETLATSNTTCIGKVYPVNLLLHISTSKDSVDHIYEEISNLDKLGKGDSYRVTCNRRGQHEFSSRDIEITVGRRLEESTGADVDLETPEKTVVVQIFQDRAYVGVTMTSNLLVKEIKKFRKYAKGERPFTRAEFKLREALKTFNVKVSEDYYALDVGAAPGGWTKVLSENVGKVVAVDPANLHPSIKELENVEHLKIRAEELSSEYTNFDVLTNDMNISPVESAAIMNDLANRLKEGGEAIMTIKFVTRDRKGHIQEAKKVLDSEYQDIKIKRMPHNKNETTLYMKKKSHTAIS